MLVVLIAVLPPRVRADDLLAHASDNTLWVSSTRNAPRDFSGIGGQRTEIRYRSLEGDSTWRQLPDLTGRAVDLASRGSSLAVLMDNGSWLMAWPSGFSSGAALPGGARPLALANDRDGIYAIGQTGPETATASAPATSPSSQADVGPNTGAGTPLPRAATQLAAAATAPADAPTSGPSIHSTDDRLALFSFDGAVWRRLADLPNDVPVPPSVLALTIADGGATVAIPDGDAIRILQWGADHAWADRGTVRFGYSPRLLQLLTVGPRTILWAAPAAGAGAIAIFDGGRWGEAKKLDLPRDLPADTPRAVAVAAGNLRLFFMPTSVAGNTTDSGRIYEQCFTFDGSRSSDVAALPSPAPLAPNVLNDYFTMAAMTALVVLMFATVRRRATDPPVALAGAAPVVLAPINLRLAAGVIDLLPVIVTLFVLVARSDEPLRSAGGLLGVPLVAAVGIYLLHTLITELAMGRTVGKIVLGLRVTAVDGTAAPAWSIVLRNLMRIIDLFPLPILSLLILISPLRQRTGDVLARTLVVMARPVETSDAAEVDEGAGDDVRRKGDARDADADADADADGGGGGGNDRS